MRSFIAIALPDQVRADIGMIIEQLRPAGPPARWVPAQNLHVTLKFLDEISPDQVSPILAAIQVAAAGTFPFELQLGGFGVFPNERRARVFWIAITSGYDPLRRLATGIDEQLQPLGFPRESRPFSAHVTLARLREPGPADRLNCAAAHVTYQSEPISVRQIDLMQSVLSPKGATYSKIGSVLLIA